MTSGAPAVSSGQDMSAKHGLSVEPDRDGGIDEWEVDPSTIDLKEKVGSGCTADVYRAFMPDRRDGSMVEVAVKEIDFCKTKMGMMEQSAFDREVAIMPKLSHENLVRFLGVASKVRPFRIITEYCSGGCLFELLHNEVDLNLSWEQLLKMCSDVAAGMNYLHQFSPQIIHRDLKSLNLLLSHPVENARSVPDVKVSDFGLSRMKEQALPAGEWGQMTVAAGTCHWMAPEVFTGSSYDEKVDVYSYAMILFEIICREIPFEEEEAADVGNMTVRGARPDLDAVPPNCPALLRRLMIHCWAHDPRTRPDFQYIKTVLASVEVPRCPPT